MNLKQKAITGIEWNMVAQIGQQIAQFVISIFLARLLMPQDFGLVAMVMVIVNFAQLFAEQGFSSALIQRQKLRSEHIHSIWWLNIIMGVCLSAILFIIAPAVATFYSEEKLSKISQVLALSFFITSFAIVPKAMLRKKLAFKQIALVEIVSIISSGCFAILLAISGFGVWSLVFQSLCHNLISTGLVWYVAHWHVRLIFKIKPIKELMNFSVNLLGFNTINFWARNADNLLIGRFMGSTSLGIYNRAYKLMLLPITQISNVLTRVMFPVLSTIQNDPHRVKKIYLNAMGVISLVASPIMLGMLVTAKPFILTIYGVKWIEVVPTLQILCGVGLLQSLMNPTGWIYMSQGRTDWLFRIGLVACTVFIVSIGVGVWIGTVKAVAISYAVANILHFYPSIMIPGKLINMKFIEVIKNVSGPLISGVMMAVVLWLLKSQFDSNWPTGIALIIQAFLGAVLYCTFLHLFNVKVYHQVRELVKERWQWHFKEQGVIISK